MPRAQQIGLLPDEVGRKVEGTPTYVLSRILYNFKANKVIGLSSHATSLSLHGAAKYLTYHLNSSFFFSRQIYLR